ncbi:hypothetical protein [Pelagicoccus mobilis]|uniref:Uncharacterized protein n=1 Tax=Pelagicoccus mobilis TaxID=415221 RepID=A0A934RZJ8_9BACT|nr:hypothetical protein [Pelagicoccus mobilis]MBK1879193.1 hypothetical protein [Pelagicoccus mobilis]
MKLSTEVLFYAGALAIFLVLSFGIVSSLKSIEISKRDWAYGGSAIAVEKSVDSVTPAEVAAASGLSHSELKLLVDTSVAYEIDAERPGTSSL